MKLLSILTGSNITVREYFLPFKKLVSNPGAVSDYFGLLDFRNLAAWTLVDKRVRKCFNGTWYIGTIVYYHLHLRIVMKQVVVYYSEVAYSVDAQDKLGPVLACVIHAEPAL